MTLQEHCFELGGLMANFHSLEFLLRAYLQKHTTPKPIATAQSGVDFYSFNVGAELPENPITNYDSLRILIDKFNHLMKTKGLVEIDSSIAEIRDALAHGRVSSAANVEQMRLIKFSRPNNGIVTITFNEEMTLDWFKQNKKIIIELINQVKAIL
ncbi:MAG TPA: hypothetical protein VFN30_11465 [Chitinophagaceae bacterium]|nr:hypothetical protein [Chitinophagaceae bacterium]